ncbi:MAG TPA: peroxiredoxin family protein, partial [Bacteroidia bacterium]|nr:peroxiredoxin family protein [Bacteroidia bacterium]
VYIFAGMQHPSDWRGWVLPAVPMLFMSFILRGVIPEVLFFQRRSKTKKDSPAETGKPAPDFSLPDIEGKPVKLSDFRGKNHVLLVFVRGDWCPTCHIMIRMYEQNREKFLAKDIVTIGISPESTETNRAMMERLGWKNMLLADTKKEVAYKYGILFRENEKEKEAETNDGHALPASFLVDRSGVMRYMSRSDRAGEFLSPALIFPVVENLS